MSKAGTDRRLPARVSSVGAGNMAEAILRGLIRAGAAPDGKEPGGMVGTTPVMLRLFADIARIAI